MQTKKERNIQLAHAVLEWNQSYLNRDSVLTDALVGECFADQFVVEPNGRRYEANRKTYKEFLDGMKSTMDSIRYQVTHAVGDEESVVFSMQVQICKSDHTTENFFAMLLVRFNDSEKISLWHEIYVQQGQLV
jgi:hypothetical protein